MTDYATEWRAAGACLSADPELFFPIAQGSAADRQISTALAGLRGLRGPAAVPRLRDGRPDEAHGIWGGTTADERIRARRRSMRRASGPPVASRRRTPAPAEDRRLATART